MKVPITKNGDCRGVYVSFSVTVGIVSDMTDGHRFLVPAGVIALC